jgi:hypothetical protein
MQFDHKSVIPALQELGVSGNHAIIYAETLKLGEATAGQLIEQTGIHRELVYRALQSLCDDRLLQKYIKHHRAVFAPVDPGVLITRMEQKQVLAQSVVSYLQAMKGQREGKVEVHMGLGGLQHVLDVILESLPDGGNYLITGASGEEYYTATREFFPRYRKAFGQKGITGKLLLYSNEPFHEQPNTQGELEVRRLPFGGTTLTPTVIAGDTLAIEILDQDHWENTVVITVENPRASQAFREQFMGLWKDAS